MAQNKEKGKVSSDMLYKVSELYRHNRVFNLSTCRIVCSRFLTLFPNLGLGLTLFLF